LPALEALERPSIDALPDVADVRAFLRVKQQRTRF